MKKKGQTTWNENARSSVLSMAAGHLSSLSSFSRHERELWERELECSLGNFANNTTM